MSYVTTVKECRRKKKKFVPSSSSRALDSLSTYLRINSFRRKACNLSFQCSQFYCTRLGDSSIWPLPESHPVGGQRHGQGLRACWGRKLIGGHFLVHYHQENHTHPWDSAAKGIPRALVCQWEELSCPWNLYLVFTVFFAKVSSQGLPYNPTTWTERGKIKDFLINHGYEDLAVRLFTIENLTNEKGTDEIMCLHTCCLLLAFISFVQNIGLRMGGLLFWNSKRILGIVVSMWLKQITLNYRGPFSEEIHKWTCGPSLSDKSTLRNFSGNVPFPADMNSLRIMRL